MSWLTKDTLWLHPTRRRPPLLALCLFLFTLYILSRYLLTTPYPPELESLPTLGKYFSIASGVVLFSMFFLYYFAYRFYEDSFYLFVSLGWLANVIHVTFETYFIDFWKDSERSLKVGVLSCLLMIPFYIAGLMDKSRDSFRRRWWPHITLAWIAFFILVTLLVKYFNPELSHLEGSDRFKIITLPTVLFSMFTLAAVGLSLRSRLRRATHGRLKDWYPVTFFFYTAIQPAYLFKAEEKFLFGMFGVALVIKIANSLMTMFAIYYSYSEVQRLQAATQARFETETSKLEVMQAKLNERSAMEELGLLTASIQHDIQNPLVVIDSEVGKLKARLQAYPDVITRLELIDHLTDKISEATNVVPLLRGSKAHFQRLMQQVALEDFVNGILKVVKREMNTANIYFRINGKPAEAKQSSKTDSKHFVRAYPPLLERAVINILKNSLEAIREAKRSSGVIDIDIKDDASPSSMTRLEIKDNGRGISAEDLPNVTSLFTTRSDRKANSGIGLYISNRIMEAHDGSLNLESEEWVGTKVTLLLQKWRDERHLT